MPRERNYGTNKYSSRGYLYNYNNTSEAYKLYPDYQEEGLGRRKKARKAKQLVKSAESMPVGTLKVITFAIVLCSLSALYVAASAGNDTRRREISYMQETLEEINENNQYLETQLNKNIDLNRIEDIAKTRLGMSKPKSYQIKYIDVQKASYTVQYNNQEDKSTGFSQIINNFFKD